MNTEPQREILPTVVADSTQRKFTWVVIIISLLVFIGIFALTRLFVPLMFLQIVGQPFSPNDMSDFILFCHTYDFNTNQSWHSYALNMNRTNTVLVLGGRFHISPSLKRDSAKPMPINNAAELATKKVMSTPNDCTPMTAPNVHTT